jgi:biopolymer transport protein ExbD
VSIWLVSTAPFAALFLLLIAIVVGFSPATGFNVTTARLEPCGYDDRRVVVVQVLSHGGLRINVEDVKREDLDRRLEEISKTRAYRYVFLTADPDLPFEEVVQVIDSAAKQIDYIAILTPSILNQARGGSLFCIDPNLPESYIAHPTRH